MITKVTQLLKIPKPKVKDLREQGFTLVEALIGIMVISVVVVAITPPILLAVGTRVQNRRAEQAIQLAQAEVDRVRVLVEQGKYTANDLPPVATASNIKQAIAPTALVNSQTGITANQALRVDIDKDGRTDFLVQTFRNNTPAAVVTVGTRQIPIAFGMGVRVYSAVAAQNLGNLENPPREAAWLRFTTGEGNQRSRPLAVMYPLIVRSDSNISMDTYKTYLNSNP